MRFAGPRHTETANWNIAGCLASLLLLGAAVFLYRVGAREVGSSVEERIAVTAREMWRADEWVVPTMNGKLRLQKPPLAYWLPQVVASTRGIFDEFTLRLPFAVLAIGTVLWTFGIGYLLGGRELGLFAGVVLLSSPLFVREGHRASTDQVLLFCVSGVWFFYALALVQRSIDDGSRSPDRWVRICVFVMLALGALAKGPVVLAVTLLPMFLLAVLERSITPLRPLWSPTGWFLFLLLALAWPALLLGRLGGDMSPEHVVRQWGLESVGKMVDSDGIEGGYVYMKHTRPWYFYLTRLPAVLGVWTALAPLLGICALRMRFPTPALGRPQRHPAGAVTRAGVEAGERSAIEMVPAVWFLGVLIFFSLLAEKKSPYLLPLAPAAALCIAQFLVPRYEDWRSFARKITTFTVVGTSIGWAFLLAWVAGLRDSVGAGNEPAFLTFLNAHVATVSLLAALLLASLVLWRRRLAGRTPALAILALGMVLTLPTLPRTDLTLKTWKLHKRLRTDTTATHEALEDSGPLYALADGLADFPSGLLYYLDRQVTFLGQDPDGLHSLPTGANVLVTQERWDGLGAPQRPSESAADHAAAGVARSPIPGYRIDRVVNPRFQRKRGRTLLIRKGN